MPGSNIEFSREGLKISYLRLLSDSTSGFILILFGLLIYYFPIYGQPLHISLGGGTNGFGISTEIKVLVIVLLALVSTPLGLIINVASWICFGRLQVRCQKYFYKQAKFTFLAKGAKVDFQFKKYIDFFNISDKDEWYQRSQLIKQSLLIYYPQILDDYEHVRGVGILFRNISFLLSLFSISMLITALRIAWYPYLWIFIAGLISSLAFMLSTGVLGFYYNSQIYIKVYILCLEIGDCDKLKQTSEIDKDKELINKLSESAKLRVLK